MEDVLGLLKAKLARIAENKDEAEMVFVTTLLTSDGYVNKQNDYSFSYYRRLRGENIFEEVKQRLLAEGVIHKNDDTLHMNCPRWNLLSDREKRMAVGELSAFFFDKGRDFYLNILLKVTSTPEGQHIFDEMVKVGPSISGDTVSRMRQYAGQYYYQQFEETMGGAGLFILKWSSNKHDYYQLFTPLVEKLHGLPSDDVLAFVYIAQYVRSDGPERAGVLETNCTKYLKGVTSI